MPKYIETIIFVFHFLKQLQRADWSAIVFGPWVDVISKHLRRGRVTLQARLRKGIENQGDNQIQNLFLSNASNNKWTRLSENKIGVRVSLLYRWKFIVLLLVGGGCLDFHDKFIAPFYSAVTVCR